jgi:hypothetical protein
MREVHPTTRKEWIKADMLNDFIIIHPKAGEGHADRKKG